MQALVRTGGGFVTGTHPGLLGHADKAIASEPRVSPLLLFFPLAHCAPVCKYVLPGSHAITSLSPLHLRRPLYLDRGWLGLEASQGDVEITPFLLKSRTLRAPLAFRKGSNGKIRGGERREDTPFRARLVVKRAALTKWPTRACTFFVVAKDDLTTLTTVVDWGDDVASWGK